MRRDDELLERGKGVKEILPSFLSNLPRRPNTTNDALPPSFIAHFINDRTAYFSAIYFLPSLISCVVGGHHTIVGPPHHMPIVVTMHASSVWPSSIDSMVFRCYLEGYSVEETVEYLMASQHAAEGPTGLPAHTSPGSALAKTAATLGSVIPQREEARIGAEEESCLVSSRVRTAAAAASSSGQGSSLQALPQQTPATATRAAGRSPTAKSRRRHRLAAPLKSVEVGTTDYPEDLHHCGGGGMPRRKRRGMMDQLQQYVSQGGSTAHPPDSFLLNEDSLSLQRRLQIQDGGPTQDTALKSCLLFEEITEQYNFYEILSQEDLLGAPYAFLSKHYLPLSITDRRTLVEEYYEVDPDVFRYYFGDKMNKCEPIDLSTERHAAANIFGWGSLRPTGISHEAAMVRLLNINFGSLKRQWENIKKVCVSMVNMYSDRGDMFVPRGVPLLTAIRRCYGLREGLAVNYATAVFGYHHRITSRIVDRLNTFEDYGTLCGVVAAQWCDDSLLVLDGEFLGGCRRVARLLDESRVLAELHHVIFGEAMRARWQVQLDEVQRAITLEKNITSAAIYTASHAPATGRGANSSPAAQPTKSETSRGAPLNAAHGTEASGPLSPNTVSSISASPASSGVSAGFAAAAASLSANQRFSRRFLLEFPHVMRQLTRLATQLSMSGSISDALESFYTRIYLPLESVSARSGPAVTSLVLTSAAAAVTRSASFPDMPSTSASPPPPSPPVLARVKRAASQPQLPLNSGRTSAECAHCITVAPAALTKSTSLQHLSAARMPSTTAVGFEHTLSHPLDSGSAAIHPATSVVNTSMAPATASLLSTTALPTADGSSPSMKLSASPQDATHPSLFPMAAKNHPLACNSEVSLVAAAEECLAPETSFSPAAVSHRVLKAMDRTHLRELCLLFNMAPSLWRQLHSLSTEDHAATDKAFTDLVISLKAVCQVLMAADDFE